MIALLAAADTFFLIYLLLTARIVGSTGPDDLRRHAEDEDEGLTLILLLAGLAVLVSVTARFLVLNADESSLATRLAALISLPLGWATVHTLIAFHYAYLHYRDEEKGEGFAFPGKAEPDAWDFLYASFTIGMTAQVSDVEVTARPPAPRGPAARSGVVLLQHRHPGAWRQCRGDGRSVAPTISSQKSDRNSHELRCPANHPREGNP